MYVICLLFFARSLKLISEDRFAQFSPQALSTIEFKYFYVFFVFNVIAFACYWFFFPETKGKTLEQMDELFGDQLVPHAMQDPAAAAAAMEKDEKLHAEVRNESIVGA